MAEQKNSQAKRPSQVACVSEDRQSLGAWDTTCGHKTKGITPSIAWRRERRGKRQRSTIILERTREDHRQSDDHWNCFYETGGACMGFSERIDTTLNWSVLNWQCLVKARVCPAQSIQWKPWWDTNSLQFKTPRPSLAPFPVLFIVYFDT